MFDVLKIVSCVVGIFMAIIGLAVCISAAHFWYDIHLQTAKFEVIQDTAKFKTEDIQYDDDKDTIYFFDKISGKAVILRGHYCIYESVGD